MFNNLKRVVRHLIPYPYHFHLDTQKRRYFHQLLNKEVRNDVQHFNLSENAHFEVYWKIYGLGRGPALALYIDDEEVLKFDFYGARKGHYHVTTLLPEAPNQTRLFLPEETVKDQIERAIFEVETNLTWYLERHPLEVVRNFKIKKRELQPILADIRKMLMAYQELLPPDDQAGDPQSVEMARN